MRDGRTEIFGRIAEALRIPAPAPHVPAGHESSHARRPAIREWLPPVGNGPGEQLALFTRQCAVLSTELRHCADAAAAAAAIGDLGRENGWTRIAVHTGSLIDPVAALLPSQFALFSVAADYAKDALESCNAGVSECESLVAQTGSVCVTSLSAGGRALSVLPPHHIVLARQAQLVPDLCSAFERLSAKYAQNLPSFISFISGPSRTGDIERILVLGAHGPRKLTILLLP
jgi:L-lactate dehydrogenase complex protein LldG